MWVAVHQTPGWLVGSIVVAVAVWLIFLSTGLRAAARGEDVDAWDMRLVHTAGLTGTARWTSPSRTGPRPECRLSSPHCLRLRTSAPWAILRRTSAASIHWLGVGASLAAVGVAIGFDGFWTVVMWSAEAAAVMWIGLKSDRFWFRVGGLALFAVAVGVWLQSAPSEQHGPFVVLLNARGSLGHLRDRHALPDWMGAKGDHFGRLCGRHIERGLVLVAAHAMTVVLMTHGDHVVLGSARHWQQRRRASRVK